MIPRISLIFVNYRSSGSLARALESIRSIENGASDFEIIVVNNDRNERAVLEGLEKSFRFSLIGNEQNGGFAQGANIGAKAARGSILGFLNPDIAWQEKCLSGIGRMFENDARIGISGMRLLRPDGQPEAWSYGSEPDIWGVLRNNLFSFLNDPPRESTPHPIVDWVSGGALFIRSDLFRDLSGFDERFFLYFEDADLCRRARNSGYRVSLASSFPLIHYGGKSQLSILSQKRFFYASQSAYFKKHRPRFEYFLLRFLRFLRHRM